MNIRTRIVKFAAAVALSATVVGIGSLGPAGAAAGDPSQWGRNRAAVAGDPSQWISAEKVNEYEGQHR